MYDNENLYQIESNFVISKRCDVKATFLLDITNKSEYMIAATEHSEIKTSMFHNGFGTVEKSRVDSLPEICFFKELQEIFVAYVWP